MPSGDGPRPASTGAVDTTLHDHFVAVGTATDLRAHAAELRRRWDASFDLGRAGGVRPVIADSWTRMLGAGLEPDRLRPTVAFDEDGLAAAREASPLGAVLPDLRGCLAGLADDAEHILVVGDAEGRLLWIEGHERVLDQARAIEFVPGMSWLEDSAGTNAIGTALAIDHAVQIFSAEHFLSEQHPWWCSAAPIHDPTTGERVGVIDLSGPQRTAHPHSLGLVMAAAAVAEERLRHRAELAAARRAATAERRPRHHAPGGRTAAPVRGRVRVLTDHGPAITTTARGHVRLSARHAEAVAVLALHPEGLTSDQLTTHLYGGTGNLVTTRALLSRLKDQVGPIVTPRPYRLAEGITVDLRTVRDLLEAGDGAAALAMYPGPLLASSEVPAIRSARDELDLAVRAVALAGGPDELWRWVATPTGRDDLAAHDRFLALAAVGDPRRPVAAARRAAITAEWAS